MRPFRDRQADPSRGQNTSKLAMREKRDVAFCRAKTRDKPVGAARYLIRHFPAWATIAKDTPARPCFANVGGVPSLVVAIIPLRQIGFDLGDGFGCRQFAGPPRPLQGTGEHKSELNIPEVLSKYSRAFLSARGQRKVGSASVPP